jgi:hypothetical protein
MGMESSELLPEEHGVRETAQPFIGSSDIASVFLRFFDGGAGLFFFDAARAPIVVAIAALPDTIAFTPIPVHIGQTIMRARVRVYAYQRYFDGLLPPPKFIFKKN